MTRQERFKLRQFKTMHDVHKDIAILRALMFNCTVNDLAWFNSHRGTLDHNRYGDMNGYTKDVKRNAILDLDHPAVVETCRVCGLPHREFKTWAMLNRVQFKGGSFIFRYDANDDFNNMQLTHVREEVKKRQNLTK